MEEERFGDDDRELRDDLGPSGRAGLSGFEGAGDSGGDFFLGGSTGFWSMVYWSGLFLRMFRLLVESSSLGERGQRKDDQGDE